MKMYDKILTVKSASKFLVFALTFLTLFPITGFASDLSDSSESDCHGTTINGERVVRVLRVTSPMRCNSYLVSLDVVDKILSCDYEQLSDLIFTERYKIENWDPLSGELPALNWLCFTDMPSYLEAHEKSFAAFAGQETFAPYAPAFVRASIISYLELASDYRQKHDDIMKDIAQMCDPEGDEKVSPRDFLDFCTYLTNYAPKLKVPHESMKGYLTIYLELRTLSNEGELQASEGKLQGREALAVLMASDSDGGYDAHQAKQNFLSLEIRQKALVLSESEQVFTEGLEDASKLWLINYFVKNLFLEINTLIGDDTKKPFTGEGLLEFFENPSLESQQGYFSFDREKLSETSKLGSINLKIQWIQYLQSEAPKEEDDRANILSLLNSSLSASRTMKAIIDTCSSYSSSEDAKNLELLVQALKQDKLFVPSEKRDVGDIFASFRSIIRDLSLTPTSAVGILQSLVSVSAAANKEAEGGQKDNGDFKEGDTEEKQPLSDSDY